ncbi:MAG: OmpH family outer membrane protein [Candidatus Omnitrophota bacterium]
MRIHTLAVLLGGMMFLFAQTLPVLAQEKKIATVDLSRAFDEFEKTKKSDETLETMGTEKKAERDKKVEEVKKLKSEMDLLSDEGKREKQAVIDQKIRELQEFDREVRDNLRGQRDQMVKEILQEIDQVIQEYGRKNGYTMILNDRVLLYKEKTLDVTEDIIQRLNEGGKKR